MSLCDVFQNAMLVRNLCCNVRSYVLEQICSNGNILCVVKHFKQVNYLILIFDVEEH